MSNWIRIFFLHFLLSLLPNIPFLCLNFKIPVACRLFLFHQDPRSPQCRSIGPSHSSIRSSQPEIENYLNHDQYKFKYYMTGKARVMQLLSNSCLIRINLTIIYTKNPLEVWVTKIGWNAKFSYKLSSALDPHSYQLPCPW